MIIKEFWLTKSGNYAFICPFCGNMHITHNLKRVRERMEPNTEYDDDIDDYVEDGSYYYRGNVIENKYVLGSGEVYVSENDEMTMCMKCLDTEKSFTGVIFDPQIVHEKDGQWTAT